MGVPVEVIVCSVVCCVEQLCLPMGVPVEVIVCSVVTPNHVFLQQPTHPTFPSLERQNYHMRMCYSVESVPHLPRPIDGTVFDYNVFIFPE